MTIDDCRLLESNEPLDSTVVPARYTQHVEEVFRRLSIYHGISREAASERLHALKRESGLPGDFNVEFDLTGNVLIPDSRDLIGSLTAGGGP